ncbi:hypothetical protein PsorP6_000199 [Peronosclerospora sorghi]|uniref:Uncharacterized protein n=1 Tax=Peronosclerospora sorghi TaxID=230839 RepID=A0ACC0WT05_9STRA|nr:hypothetical protein PsorP6_000199 [Peronosclerospora sorghi]
MYSLLSFIKSDTRNVYVPGKLLLSSTKTLIRLSTLQSKVYTCITSAILAVHANFRSKLLVQLSEFTSRTNGTQRFCCLAFNSNTKSSSMSNSEAAAICLNQSASDFSLPAAFSCSLILFARRMRPSIASIYR